MLGDIDSVAPFINDNEQSESNPDCRFYSSIALFASGRSYHHNLFTKREWLKWLITLTVSFSRITKSECMSICKNILAQWDRWDRWGKKKPVQWSIILPAYITKSYNLTERFTAKRCQFSKFSINGSMLWQIPRFKVLQVQALSKNVIRPCWW